MLELIVLMVFMFFIITLSVVNEMIGKYYKHLENDKKLTSYNELLSRVESLEKEVERMKE